MALSCAPILRQRQSRGIEPAQQSLQGGPVEGVGRGSDRRAVALASDADALLSSHSLCSVFQHLMAQTLPEIDVLEVGRLRLQKVEVPCLYDGAGAALHAELAENVVDIGGVDHVIVVEDQHDGLGQFGDLVEQACERRLDRWGL